MRRALCFARVVEVGREGEWLRGEEGGALKTAPTRTPLGHVALDCGHTVPPHELATVQHDARELAAGHRVVCPACLALTEPPA